MASMDVAVTPASQPYRCCQPDEPSSLMRKKSTMLAPTIPPVSRTTKDSKLVAAAVELVAPTSLPVLSADSAPNSSS